MARTLVQCAHCYRGFPIEYLTLGADHRYHCRGFLCQPYVPAPPCAVCGDESDDLHPDGRRLCASHDPRYTPAGGTDR